jgi:hypothetical protein
MGTSMAHPQSLQSLQQAAGGYQVRPYPTAPANLPDGLQGYYVLQQLRLLLTGQLLICFGIIHQVGQTIIQ